MSRGDTWPAQLQAMHTRLSAQPALNVLNRAVRASRADFAALCFEELIPKGTRLDAAIVDYSFTSSAYQIIALVDRLRAARIPTLVLLYCPHTGWQRHVHCGLKTRGYCPRANASEARRGAGAWKVAPPVARAGARAAGRGIRPGFGSSLTDGAAAVGGAIRTAGVGAPLALSRVANETFEELHKLGMDGHVMWYARHRLYPAMHHAAADPAVADNVVGVLAAATAAAFVLGRLNKPQNAAYAWLRRAVEEGVGDPSAWMDSLSAVAAGECFATRQHVELVEQLEIRGVPYTSNVAQLSLLAEEVLARDGNWGAHPSANGHRLMALAVDQILRRMLRPADGPPCKTAADATASEGGPGVDGGLVKDVPPLSEQTCSYGRDALALLVLDRSGFELIDETEGRTGGLRATSTGASCSLRLTSRTLSAGWMNIGYEHGWRNLALASVTCMHPCACVGLSINATNPKPYTGTAFSASIWASLGSTASGGFECVLRVDARHVASGRLLLQAVTLAAPLAGNRSVWLKDSLEIARAVRRADPLPF